VQQVNAYPLAEQHAHHMRGVADARRAEGEAARLLARGGNKLVEGLERRLFADQQHEARRARQQRDRGEVRDRIEGQALEQRGIGGEATGGVQHRVAVGPRARDLGGADRATGAAAVFDDDGAAGVLADGLGDDTCRDVRAAAGAERDDDALLSFLRAG
jgi:hypothetical protein